MAWNPVVHPDEKVLVSLSHVLENQTRFDLLVTDAQVAYSRRLAFAVSGPIETVSVPRSEVSHVSLCRRTAFWRIAIGAFLLLLLAFQAYTWVTGTTEEYSGKTLLLGVVGVSLILSARHGWRLEFEDKSGKRHRLDQPAVFSRAVRDQMTQALRDASAALQPR